MKKNNGFTLVELLAVIVILGIVMSIGGIAAVNIKKDANVKEADEITAMLIDLGPGIYSYEYMSGKRGDNYFYTEYNDLSMNHSLHVSFDELYEAGYLKEVVKSGSSFQGIKNPAGGDACKGYLSVKKTNDGPEFGACLYCPGIHDNNTCGTPPSVGLTKES